MSASRSADQARSARCTRSASAAARSPQSAANASSPPGCHAQRQDAEAGDELEDPHRGGEAAAERQRLDRLDVRDPSHEPADPRRAQRLGVEAQETMQDPIAQDRAGVDRQPAGGARRRQTNGGQQRDERDPAPTAAAALVAATARVPIVAQSATSSAS